MSKSDLSTTGVPFCNICGSTEFHPVEKPWRNQPLFVCDGCNATPRFRLVANAAINWLFADASYLAVCTKSTLRGIGLSDPAPYARPLAELCDYTNTFFHTEPFFDVTAPAPPFVDLDFLISSDVFEHIAPPVSRAFSGAYAALKSGGRLILTIPINPGRPYEEHFPDAHIFEIVELDGEKVLVNKRRDGNYEVFDDLVFHGGKGQTLEFRHFTRAAVLDQLKDAGFVDIETVEPDFPENHIFPHDTAPLFTARKP